LTPKGQHSYVPWKPDKKAIKNFFDDLLAGRKATSPATDATPLTGKKADNPVGVTEIPRVSTVHNVIKPVKCLKKVKAVKKKCQRRSQAQSGSSSQGDQLTDGGSSTDQVKKMYILKGPLWLEPI
jgi:hypothetical protein